LKNETTGETMPIMIGVDGINGSPANIAALFTDSNNHVITIYPCGPVVHYHPE